VIDGSAPGTAPIVDPIATVVLAADTANVDTVIIGGQIRKRNGKLTGDWSSALKKVQASSAYLRDALAKKQREAATS